MNIKYACIHARKAESKSVKAEVKAVLGDKQVKETVAESNMSMLWSIVGVRCCGLCTRCVIVVCSVPLIILWKKRGAFGTSLPLMEKTCHRARTQILCCSADAEYNLPQHPCLVQKLWLAATLVLMPYLENWCLCAYCFMIALISQLWEHQFSFFLLQGIRWEEKNGQMPFYTMTVHADRFSDRRHCGNKHSLLHYIAAL